MSKKLFQTRVAFISFLGLGFCFLFNQQSLCMNRDEKEAQMTLRNHSAYKNHNAAYLGSFCGHNHSYVDESTVFKYPGHWNSYNDLKDDEEGSNFNKWAKTVTSDIWANYPCLACREAAVILKYVSREHIRAMADQKAAALQAQQAALFYQQQVELAQQQARYEQEQREKLEKEKEKEKEKQNQSSPTPLPSQNNAGGNTPGNTGSSGNNLLSTIKALKSTLTQNEKDIKELNEEKKGFDAYKLKSKQDVDNLTKEKDELSSLNLSLQTKQLEKEKEIANLNEEKQTFKKFEEKMTQENDSLKKEKDDLLSSIGILKKNQEDKEKEITELTEERTKLYALTADGDKTAEIIKEMMKVIGVNTDDFTDCSGNIFAQKCLDRLKAEMGSI